MSKIVPLHDHLAPLREAIDMIEKNGPHRVVLILDDGPAAGVYQAGYDDDSEVRALLHSWYEQYLIDEMLERIE